MTIKEGEQITFEGETRTVNKKIYSEIDTPIIPNDCCTQEIIHKAVNDISTNHAKIIDDWCKAYLSKSYQERGEISPGSFILNHKPSYSLSGEITNRYWFEEKKPEFTEPDLSYLYGREKIHLDRFMQAIVRCFDYAGMNKILKEYDKLMDDLEQSDGNG